ncbi:transcription factor 21 [Hippocampus zosterae]|uniref:transcription factor 21 n=1 Tax=Hippocampus zosterae TaxID=109293 RepID=UPI00223DE304|nr:transcription factor 21 [Hippocampus zosterae]
MSASWDEEDRRSEHGGKESHRDAANARERARMRVLSKAFSRLKTTLPWVPPDTKLSKLDTLRLATSYISHLRRLLQDHSLDDAYVKTASLTWPFGMSGHLEDEDSHSKTTTRLCDATA